MSTMKLNAAVLMLSLMAGCANQAFQPVAPGSTEPTATVANTDGATRPTWKLPSSPWARATVPARSHCGGGSPLGPGPGVTLRRCRRTRGGDP